MRDDDFEWDNATSIANDDKHGATFERARLAFSDSLAVGGYDDREDYGEDRYALIGMVEATLLFVAYTERDDRVPIISARRATKHEQDDYYQQNGQSP